MTTVAHERRGNGVYVNPPNALTSEDASGVLPHVRRAMSRWTAAQYAEIVVEFFVQIGVRCGVEPDRDKAVTAAVRLLVDERREAVRLGDPRVAGYLRAAWGCLVEVDSQAAIA